MVNANRQIRAANLNAYAVLVLSLTASAWAHAREEESSNTQQTAGGTPTQPQPRIWAQAPLRTPSSQPVQNPAQDLTQAQQRLRADAP